MFIISFYQINLVPNPSFEDTLSNCPSGPVLVNQSPPWINPTLGSPDYFNSCNSFAPFSTPTNQLGFENAHTGKAYCDFGAITLAPGWSNNREYIQVQLITPLILGEIYCVEFYVSLNDSSSEYAVNNIGVYFSTNAISIATHGTLPYTPQITNPSSNPLTNTIGWTKVSGVFIAQGGEQYITIGNFNDDNHSDTVFVRQPSNIYQQKECIYYLDDVSVIHLDDDAGQDTAICQGGSVMLGRPSHPWLSYSWYPSIGLSNDTIAQPIATPTVTTTYYLTATLNGGCSKLDTVTVTVVNAHAGNDTTLCYNSSATIGAAAQNNVNYTWQPATGLSNANTAQPIATPLNTATYTVTAATNGCTISDSITINVLQNIAANAGNDVTIMLGTNTTLTGSTLTGASFNWSPPTYLSCDTCATTLASPTNTTTYVLTASQNSCSSTDTVTVYVDTDCGELFVPNVFSPNGDGANDFLNVYGNCITAIDFLIFDRWGELVFESTDINQGWDGTYKGQKLDEAVFVYKLTATVNGKIVEKKGNVSLVK